jgi:hypothetical protein
VVRGRGYLRPLRGREEPPRGGHHVADVSRCVVLLL